MNLFVHAKKKEKLRQGLASNLYDGNRIKELDSFFLGDGYPNLEKSVHRVVLKNGKCVEPFEKFMQKEGFSFRGVVVKSNFPVVFEINIDEKTVVYVSSVKWKTGKGVSLSGLLWLLESRKTTLKARNLGLI